jgi:isoleucyl-tRNA synthetase
MQEIDVKTIKGSQLVGLKYKPLMPFFKDKPNAFKILSGEFVTTAEGTGIVHMAPGFGEDDHMLCKKNNIETVCPVDDGANFTDEIFDIPYTLANKNETLSVVGRHVFECNDDIIKYLKSTGAWVKTEQYFHNYPHCWRTGTPLIFRAINSWYVKVTQIKDKLIEHNQKINWIPGHVKDGIFGKWLENTRDWSISRNRFWGCPIPVWKSSDPAYPRIDVYGSIAQMEADFGDYYEQTNGEKLEITNLHRPFIDTLTRPNPNDPTGKSMMVRIEDVLDCWFESGSMPFAQIHYPFEKKEQGKIVRTQEQNQEWFHKNFPADFIVEYTAQTRGWFYTLTVLGVALFDSPAFLNCICHGVLLDEKGQKLSKSLQNYPDPIKMLNAYGSDAMRFLMAKSGVMRGNEFNIDLEGNFIKEIARTTIAGFYNSFSFLQMYMQADGLWNCTDKEKVFFNTSSQNTMDMYILAKVKDLVESIKFSMDKYDTPTACAKIDDFIDVLNNWYIRRSKKRFWSKRTTISAQQMENIKAGSDNSSIAEEVRNILLSDDYTIKTRITYTTKENTYSIVCDDKFTAYQTLYSVILLMSQAAAPLLPCITEHVYLSLTLNENSVQLSH